MNVKSSLAMLVMAAAAAALASGTASAAKKPHVRHSAKCVMKHGKGWAPTESMAKFQAWEIVAQTTGNWPIASDKLVERRYKCKPDGSGVTCYSWIDVCKG